MGQQQRRAIALDLVMDLDPVSIDFRHALLSHACPLLISFYRDLFTAVNCSTSQAMRLRGSHACMHRRLFFEDCFRNAQHAAREIYSPREISEVHCLGSGTRSFLQPRLASTP